MVKGECMKILDQLIEKDFALYNGDSMEIIKEIPDESIGYSIFSPPFAELYVYSDSERDVGNAKNYGEFWEHFKYLIPELYRVLKPGRCVTFHCMDIPAMKERDGYIGMKDFSGDLIRAFQEVGFIYHDRVTIWKDPLIEATRTKALGLMYKQLCKDSHICRTGNPDYLITMRKPGENKEPISHEENVGLGAYAGKQEYTPTETGIKYNHRVWQLYASPVWMDIRQTYTLQSKAGLDEKDEKHICPLQLDTIHRCIMLWTNRGDIVYDPFNGIGSTGAKCLELGRKYIGSELKPSYYNASVDNLMKQMNVRNARLFS
jgi:DNA modification methylase